MEPTKRKIAGQEFEEAKRHRVNTRGRKRPFSEVELEYPPLPIDFTKATEELRRRFLNTPNPVTIRQIYTHLKGNFLHQFDFHSRQSLTKLHASVANIHKGCAHLIEKFLEKDHRFIFSKLTRDVRSHIYSFLNKEDRESARQFYRGFGPRFIVDWVNIKKVPMKTFSSDFRNALLSAYGMEFKILNISDIDVQFLTKSTQCLCVSNLKIAFSHNHIADLFEKCLNPDTLKKLSIRSSHLSKDSSMLITRHTGLNKLTLHRSSIEDFTFLSHLNSLTTLAIRFTVNTLSVFDYLPTSLNKLELAYGKLTTLNGLSALTNLTCLGLDHNPLDSLSLQPISTIVSLRVLSIRSTRVGEVSFLNTLTSLNSLSMSSCVNIGDEAILSLATSVRSLTYLDISHNAITHVVAGALSHLTCLKSLDVSSTAIGNNDVGLQGIASLTHLRFLDISSTNCKYTKGLQLLGKLTNLEELNCGQNYLTDNKLAFLVGLTNLQSLGLWQNSLQSPHLLTSLTTLRKLNVYDNKIRSSDIRLFFSLPYLLDMSFHNNNFNDDELIELNKERWQIIQRWESPLPV